MERPRRSQLVDQWRPEDIRRDKDELTSRKERARSPLPTRRERDFERVKADSRHDTQPLSLHSRVQSRSRNRSRDRRHTKRRSPSHSHYREDDLYRPARKRPLSQDRAPSPAQDKDQNLVSSRHHRKSSRSPGRAPSNSRRQKRSLSPRRAHKATAPSQRDHSSGISPRLARDSHRSSRVSPRRRSPDSYIPSGRRRSRSPVASLYRPAETRRKEPSLSPNRPSVSRRGPASQDLLSHKYPPRKTTPSPERDSRSRRYTTTRLTERDDDIYNRSVKPSHRSPSPRSNARLLRHNRPSRQARSASRSPSRRKDKGNKNQKSTNGEADMRPSYSGYSSRGGPSRSSRPSYDAPAYPNSPHYPSQQQMSPYPQSSYGNGGPSWSGQQPYGSHHG